MFLHKLHFSVIHLPDICILISCTLVSSNTVGKAKATVVMYGIYCVGEDLIESGKVHTKCIPLEENDVVRIDGPNSGHNSIVESQEPSPLLICWLIQKIVTCYPGIRFVSFCNEFPEIDHSILEVLVVPESSISCRVVAVPIL